MEFQYRVSEKEYLRAYWLAARFNCQGAAKKVALGCLLAICILLWFRFAIKPPAAVAPANPPFAASQAPAGNGLMSTVSQVAVFGGVWAILFASWLPGLARRQYRKDALCQGTLTATVTPGSLALRSSEGKSFDTAWIVFNGWQEKDGMVLLRYPNGKFQVLNVAGLAERDRVELRSILAEALPGKL
jgi:hypothetical protein